MGTNKHAAERVRHDRTTPPGGPDRLTDQDHALRAGKRGPSQRKTVVKREAPTRDEGRDDRRTGTDSNRH